MTCLCFLSAVRRPGRRDPHPVWRGDGCRYAHAYSLLPPAGVEASAWLLFADGDMEELEEELKLLMGGPKPDPGPASSLPEVPSGLLQPSGGSGLPGSPAAPRCPNQLCEQLERLAVTDAGPPSACPPLSREKRTFANGFFFSVQTHRRRKVLPASWRRCDASTSIFTCIRNI